MLPYIDYIMYVRSGNKSLASLLVSNHISCLQLLASGSSVLEVLLSAYLIVSAVQLQVRGARLLAL